MEGWVDVNFVRTGTCVISSLLIVMMEVFVCLKTRRKRMNLFRRWLQGMKEITPEQQQFASMIGTLGTTVGAIGILLVMILRREVLYAFFILFIVWLQFFGFLGAKTQYKNLVKLRREVQSLGVQEMIRQAERMGGVKEGEEE